MDLSQIDQDSMYSASHQDLLHNPYVPSSPLISQELSPLHKFNDANVEESANLGIEIYAAHSPGRGSCPSDSRPSPPFTPQRMDSQHLSLEWAAMQRTPSTPGTHSCTTVSITEASPGRTPSKRERNHTVEGETYTPGDTYYAPTDSDRVRIRTSLEWGHTVEEVQSNYKYTMRQIRDAIRHRRAGIVLSPGICRLGDVHPGVNGSACRVRRRNRFLRDRVRRRLFNARLIPSHQVRHDVARPFGLAPDLPVQSPKISRTGSDYSPGIKIELSSPLIKTEMD